MCVVVFFFKQKTAYERRISDWSSDVCSSDLCRLRGRDLKGQMADLEERPPHGRRICGLADSTHGPARADAGHDRRRNPRPGRSGGAVQPEDAGNRARSEERRVGKGGCSKCSSRWCEYPSKKKQTQQYL